MPISSTTRRISPREWEDRKRRIIELYLDRRLKLTGSDGVIETMTSEGFIATKAQYEQQFRIWEVRKNMKKSEWANIVHQGGATSTTLSDRVISGPRFDRARRRYKPRRPQTEESGPRDDNEQPQENTAPPIPTPALNDGAMNTAINEGVGDFNFHPGMLLETSNESTDMLLPENPGAIDQHMGIDDLPYLLTSLEPQLFGIHDSALETRLFYNAGLLSPSLHHFGLFPGPDLGAETLYIQPSSQLAGDASFDTAPEWIQCFPSPVVAPPSLLPSAEIVIGVIEGFRRMTPLARNNTQGDIELRLLKQQILAAIEKYVPAIRAEKAGSPLAYLPAVKNLLSTKSSIWEEPNWFAMLPNNVTAEARLCSRLVVSAINGFAGLQNVPAAGVLRFLIDHPVTRPSLTMSAGSMSTAVARSLTQNIFQAALEADNVDIVEYLLDHSTLVDANETVCHHHGQRYTPLEKAAIHQSGRVIRLLIHRKVDVNKSFPRPRCRNVLDVLLQDQDRQSTLNDNVLGLVDALLEAKTTILVDLVRSALRDFTDPRLAIRLIEMSPSQTAREIISERLLHFIITHLGQLDATNSIQLIIRKCRESDGDHGLHKISKFMDIALYAAIDRGYEEVVGTLLPYNINPGEILQKARVRENQAIIDLVLRQNAGLGTGSDSLIAAIKSGDHDCLRSLEEKGVLGHLQGRELVRVLTAALRAGNREYATKIMDIEPDFYLATACAWKHNSPGDHFYAVVAALNAALAHDFDDIAWKLMAVMPVPIPVSGKLAPLYTAVKERKPDFVRAIIDSGFGPKTMFHDTEWPILEAALECGDDSILTDICVAHSHIAKILDRRRKLPLFKLALEKGPPGLFWKILQSACAGDRYARCESHYAALEAVIECENIPVLDELIAHGAKLDDDETLEKAISKHPSMVRPLLERYSNVHPQGCAGYGRQSIITAIREYPKSSKLLDMFFAFNLVTAHILKGDGQNITPLDAAIRWYRKEEPDTSLIERLLHAGSGVNNILEIDHTYRSFIRATPLLLAIDKESVELVQLFIEHHAEINKPARFGIQWTPLQKAAEVNNPELVQLLLEKGADVNAAPAIFRGATALQFAALNGNFEIATMLLERGARLDTPPAQGPHGRWPLEGAAENGRLDMIQFLWNKNGGPFDDEQCRKATRLAEYNGYLGCRDLIKELMAKSRSNITWT